MWHALISLCSPDSLRARFGGLFREITHDMAARYCFIDYDREIAMAAELETDGVRRLIGVGRLVTDPTRNRAEFAILVGDPWQGRGLGLLLTRSCLEIARAQGLQQVVAETDLSNSRMISTFRELGFELRENLPDRRLQAVMNFS